MSKSHPVCPNTGKLPAKYTDALEPSPITKRTKTRQSNSQTPAMDPKRVRTLKPASRKPLKAPMFEYQQPLDDFDAQMAHKNMMKIRLTVYTVTISAKDQ